MYINYINLIAFNILLSKTKRRPPIIYLGVNSQILGIFFYFILTDAANFYINKMFNALTSMFSV